MSVYTTDITKTFSVSLEGKLIFGHNFKCGGTAIVHQIEKSFGKPRPYGYYDVHDSEFFKFCFVRNTFDRLVSVWADNCSRLWTDWSFKRFLFDQVAIEDVSRLWACQAEFAESFPWDFIGKFDQFADAWDYVATVCPGLPNVLPVEGASKHDHYSVYYDQEDIDFVSEKFHREISMFTFSFNGSTQ